MFKGQLKDLVDQTDFSMEDPTAEWNYFKKKIVILAKERMYELSTVETLQLVMWESFVHALDERFSNGNVSEDMIHGRNHALSEIESINRNRFQRKMDTLKIEEIDDKMLNIYKINRISKLVKSNN